MIEMPIDVNVECTDGRAGTSTHVVFNPTSRKVTHLVVSDNKAVVENSYLVSIDTVAETRHDVIKLNCTLAELAQLEPFIDIHYIKNPGPEPGYPADSIYLAPYVSPLDMEYLSVEVERIPIALLYPFR